MLPQGELDPEVGGHRAKGRELALEARQPGGLSLYERVEGLEGREGDAAGVEGKDVAVDPRTILAGVLTLPIERWSYQGETARHLGPMAQDFAAAFGLGQDDRHIFPLDAAGVALAALQGLHALVQAQEARLETLERELEALRAETAALRIELAVREREHVA